MKEVILLTGATGFLGAHIGKLLCNNQYHLVATRRAGSNLETYGEVGKEITWIDIEEENWIGQVITLKPSTIIHTAWIGVAHSQRNDREVQSKNILLLQDILLIAKASQTQRIIGLGSQAEYGYLDSVVAESHTCKPDSAYGAVKTVCCELLKNFCLNHGIQWYWLRVFSIFGEGESRQWLLPDFIQTMLEKKVSAMDFTGGEQQYAYLYIDDFIEAISRLVFNQQDKSGVYNLSAIELRPLKTLLEFVRDSVDPNFQLNFGVIPYRTGQSMLIAGDMELFKKTFGPLRVTPLEMSIRNTINFYKSTVVNESF
ncbi:MAG: NAD(P)-dependent oxidoreductase [Ferruginibacter sp.]|nr:NAD(P)-dependent oxidoreductase [Ferruginibacter sp.]